MSESLLGVEGTMEEPLFSFTTTKFAQREWDNSKAVIYDYLPEHYSLSP